MTDRPEGGRPLPAGLVGSSLPVRVIRTVPEAGDRFRVVAGDAGVLRVLLPGRREPVDGALVLRVLQVGGAFGVGGVARRGNGRRRLRQPACAGGEKKERETRRNGGREQAAGAYETTSPGMSAPCVVSATARTNMSVSSGENWVPRHLRISSIASRGVRAWR